MFAVGVDGTGGLFLLVWRILFPFIVAVSLAFSLVLFERGIVLLGRIVLDVVYPDLVGCAKG